MRRRLGTRGCDSITECCTCWIYPFGVLLSGGGKFGALEMPGRRVGGGAVAREVNTTS